MNLLNPIANCIRPFPFKGKVRMLSRMYPNSGVERAKVFGYAVDLDLADHIERHVYMGTYEREESALVRRHLQPGMTFLDVGANIGYYSLMAASLCGPAARIIAFEPNPVCISHLKKTIAENHIGQITVEHLALSDTAGVSRLFLPEQVGNNSASMISTGAGRPVPVMAATLDGYLEAHQIERVDFMKIDVEGFEPAVIRGAQDAIRAGKIGAILYESHGAWLRHAGTTPKELYHYLKSLGMRSDEEPTEEFLEWHNILVKPAGAF